MVTSFRSEIFRNSNCVHGLSGSGRLKNVCNCNFNRMARKKSKPRSKLTRIATRPSRKDNIVTPNYVQGPLSGALLRCKNWLVSQKGTKCLKNLHNTDPEFTENVDIPPVQTDSLAIIKYKRTKDLVKNVFFGCEWKYCIKEYETEKELGEHVEKHIAELEIESDKLVCEWDLCYFSTSCNEEIARHIYYHTYHTILKTYGESLAMNKTVLLPPCTRDSRTRNVVPELPSDFPCRWEGCDKTFMSILKFHDHVRLHCLFLQESLTYEESTSSNVKYACRWEFCNKKFRVVYRLLEHARKHSNQKLIGCFHCGMLFKTNTTYFDHCKRQIVNNTQEYQCVQCFKYFATERLLRTHVMTHINCYKCSLCDITCTSANTLARHFRYKHVKDRPIQCSTCNFRAVNKEDMFRHILHVHKKKIYECGEQNCTYRCKSLFLLKRHDAEKHENNPSRYACHVCDKFYTCGAKLSKHLTQIHGFQVPFGYGKFTYRMDENGVYRLQTTRIESLEASKQTTSGNITQPRIIGDVTYELSQIDDSNDGGIKIGLTCKIDSIKRNVCSCDEESSFDESKGNILPHVQIRTLKSMAELLEDPRDDHLYDITSEYEC